MDPGFQDVHRTQREVCGRNGSQFVESNSLDMLGFASGTVGLVPLNGLRHSPTSSTCGWYLWFGEYSEVADFFQPMHVVHIYEKYPEAKPLLGSAPGHRFLLAEDHLDVWFDEHLLDTKESE